MPGKPLRFACLRGVDILKQLQFEEILLRQTTDNWCLVNFGAPQRTVVVGFSGKIPELVNVEPAYKDGIPVIRRYTGGGTVIVDRDTLFTTFIMNAGDVPSKPFPRDIMNWSETIFKPAFNHTGQCSEFGLREHDYVIADKKVGGNAQTITKDRWVHHTSFLWSFDPQSMGYLAMPKKRPQYRNDRPHSEFLTTLKEYFDSPGSFEAALLTEAKQHYNVEIIDEKELDRVTELVLKAQGKSWSDLDKVVRTKIEPLERIIETLSLS